LDKPKNVNKADTKISNIIWKILIFATVLSPPVYAKSPANATSTVTDCHMGMPRICRTKKPPANKPSDSQEINIFTNEYQAKIVWVPGPNRCPMNSGSVRTADARYRGAKTTASRNRNTNAYQSKLTATIPEVYTTVAKASNMEGPTLVAHILKPILYQLKDFPARKCASPSTRLREENKPIANNANR